MIFICVFQQVLEYNIRFDFLMKLFGYTGFGSAFSGKVRKDLQPTNQVQKRYFPEKELQMHQSLDNLSKLQKKN